MFCLCFTEHTKAHAFCLWPYMQKNHICFKHTLQLNCCKPIGMKMKINQVSLKVLWGKSQTVGCWWWRPSIWLSVCEITYFVPLGSTSIHAVLSHNSSDLSLCVPWKTEKSQAYTHILTHDELLCLDFVSQLWMLIELWDFLGKHAWQSTSKQSLCFDDCILKPSDIFFFLFRVILLFTVLLLLCSVCSFNSLMWISFFFFWWANKEPHEVAKCNTVFSSIKYLFSLYQRLQKRKKSVFWGFLFC